ncbi:MAG: aspartate 1-decarboxylase, partial [Nitrococcus sp.]|nr:aspartate 1-decarboxylase [Nitrococcus sp.]
TTYAIRAEGGSRIISMNGAAAHKAHPGDRVIICCYALVPEAEVEAHQPAVVYCDEHNRISHATSLGPQQVA